MLAQKIAIVCGSTLLWTLLILYSMTSAIAEETVTESSAIFFYSDPQEVCSLVSSPGDILLQKLVYKPSDEDTPETLEETATDVLYWKRRMAYLIRAKELLSFNGYKMEFFHSEIIDEIFELRNLFSWSFFPPIFDSKRPEDHKGKKLRRHDNSQLWTRENFSVFRYRNPSEGHQLKMREIALANVDREILEETDGGFDPLAYHSTGTCADFVNWAYLNSITSRWNFIPIVRQIIATLWPPEAISTPDNISESPYSEKICEINNYKELKFPQSVPIQSVLIRAVKGTRSKNTSIQTHSQAVLSKLEAAGMIIDLNGVWTPAVDSIVFQLENH